MKSGIINRIRRQTTQRTKLKPERGWKSKKTLRNKTKKVENRGKYRGGGEGESATRCAPAKKKLVNKVTEKTEPATSRRKTADILQRIIYAR